MSSDTMNEQLIRLSGPLFRQFGDVPPRDLPPTIRTFLAVWALEADVNSGGFSQYFFNYSGAYAPFTVSALVDIGANAAADIVRRALAVVGNDIDWELNNSVRSRQVANLSDAQDSLLNKLDNEFYTYPDDLTFLLYQFVITHRDEFSVVAPL